LINNIDPVQQDNKKQSLFARLPRVSSTSRLVLLLGIFLIILIPLLLINQQQPAKQADLQQQLFLLQKIQSSPLGKTDTVKYDIKQADGELQKLVAELPRPDQSPDILTRLINLGSTYGVTVIKTEIKSGPLQLIPMSKDKTQYPAISFTLGLKGQVSKFQNFMLALEKFPYCRISELTFTPAIIKGDEDQASIQLDLFVYQDQK
jgi:hypothetical protein